MLNIENKTNYEVLICAQSFKTVLVEADCEEEAEALVEAIIYSTDLITFNQEDIDNFTVVACRPDEEELPFE